MLLIENKKYQKQIYFDSAALLVLYDTSTKSYSTGPTCMQILSVSRHFTITDIEY